jgi:16S rRNA (cytidine1402-2'-O)-methyltransferase
LRETTELGWKEIVKQVAREFGLPKSDVYRESLELRNRDDG